jgi:hypothetical protein
VTPIRGKRRKEKTMPSKKCAYADLFRDWKRLLDACGANRDLLPGMDRARRPLSRALEETRELRNIQEGLLGARRRVTELLREKREEGAESARRLRGYVKSHVGTKSERLEEFGITPIRPRSSKGRKK